MDLNKLTMGDRVIAVSGIVLFIFSFFAWFEASASIGPIDVSDTGNAWDFTLPLLAVLLGIAMVVLVALKAFGVALPESAPWGIILLVAGAVAFLLVLIKLIAGVDVDDPTGVVDVSRKFGIFVGLVASAGLAVGGFLRFQEEQASASSAPPAA